MKMKKCKGANYYKGMSKPRCNNGLGCDVCNTKFQEACEHHIAYLLLGNNNQLICSKCNKVLDSVNLNKKLVEISQWLSSIRSDLNINGIF